MKNYGVINGIITEIEKNAVTIAISENPNIEVVVTFGNNHRMMLDVLAIGDSVIIHGYITARNGNKLILRELKTMRAGKNMPNYKTGFSLCGDIKDIDKYGDPNSDDYAACIHTGNNIAVFNDDASIHHVVRHTVHVNIRTTADTFVRVTSKRTAPAKNIHDTLAVFPGNKFHLSCVPVLVDNTLFFDVESIYDYDPDQDAWQEEYVYGPIEENPKAMFEAFDKDTGTWHFIGKLQFLTHMGIARDMLSHRRVGDTHFDKIPDDASDTVREKLAADWYREAGAVSCMGYLNKADIEELKPVYLAKAEKIGIRGMYPDENTSFHILNRLDNYDDIRLIVWSVRGRAVDVKLADDDDTL